MGASCLYPIGATGRLTPLPSNTTFPRPIAPGNPRGSSLPHPERHVQTGLIGNARVIQFLVLPRPVAAADRLRRRPLLASGAGRVPSMQPQPAAAARSKSWHGNARSGHAAQELTFGQSPLMQVCSSKFFSSLRFYVILGNEI